MFEACFEAEVGSRPGGFGRDADQELETSSLTVPP